MTSVDPNRQKLTHLRKLLIQHFSLDELRVLCFDLGLEYEDLPGSTRTTKMHGLIEYLQRRGELPRLLKEVIEYRPNVTWPTFADSSTATQKDEPTGRSKSFIHEKTGLEILLISAGAFLYGEKKDLKFLPDFWIAKTPVTNVHYTKFVEDTGYKTPHHWENGKYPAELANHPVVYVSWHDAAAYAQWAGLQLPTEQQWEKAARGQDGREYPWGDEWKPYCNTKEAGIGTTSPVGYYSPFGDSPHACVDMSGNVCEWTESWYGLDNKRHVVRGGSWDDTQLGVQIVVRWSLDPNYRSADVGFRTVFPFDYSS